MTSSDPLALLFFQTVSAMTFVVLLMSILRQLIRNTHLFNGIMGLFLGGMAMLVMAYPMQLASGVSVDNRALIVGVAGAFFGAPGAILATGIAAIARLSTGGLGVWSGTTSILVAGVMGYYWGNLLHDRYRHSDVGLFYLGGLICFSLLCPVFFLPEGWRVQFYMQVGLPLSFINCGGALVLGFLIRRELAFQSMTRSLRHAANTDPLTSLPNRRSFSTEVSKWTGNDMPIALLYMDLDEFKKVNDVHGHAAGDAVLMHIGDILRYCCPKDAIAARLGGEEFAIAWPNIQQNQAEEFGHTLCRQIEMCPVQHAGLTIPITASIGMAYCHRGGSFDFMLRTADTHLYAAKNTGRNRFVGPREYLKITAADMENDSSAAHAKKVHHLH